MIPKKWNLSQKIKLITMQSRNTSHYFKTEITSWKEFFYDDTFEDYSYTIDFEELVRDFFGEN